MTTGNDSASFPPASGATPEQHYVAEHLWALADDITDVRATWERCFTDAEKTAFGVVSDGLLRLGGQLRKNELPSE